MRFFLIYTTANESDYLVDYANILRMTQLHPGVDVVEVLMVVSCVQDKSEKDNIAISAFKRVINHCPWLEWRGVIYKSNVGRDFSSAQSGLKELSKYASNDDLIMVRNRSAYGPFQEKWVTQYTSMLMENSKVGLVGNTINQSGHPDQEYDQNEITCHVQTYLYVSRFGILRPFIDQFPGALEVDRMELINKGELQLSREIMAQGFSLKCLLWPDHQFSGNNTQFPELPPSDVKNQVLGLPFEHRHSKIPYVNKKLKRRWKWVIRFQKWRK